MERPQVTSREGSSLIKIHTQTTFSSVHKIDLAKGRDNYSFSGATPKLSVSLCNL